MKLLKFSAFICVFLIFIACPENFGRFFIFSNNSTMDVYVYFGIGDRESGGYRYTDTTLSFIRAGGLWKAKENYRYDYHSEKVDTFCLFIFDADTFNICNWEEIQSGYKILQRYDLSFEDIKALKDSITYPPDEKMKEMKMYPSYGQ